MTVDDAASGSLEVTVTGYGSATVLTVSGEIDLLTSAQLTESIDAAVTANNPTALIVDLTDVPFLASMGMTVLLDASRRVSDTATFAVVADGPNTSRPLTLLGLDQELTLYTDLDTALAAVGVDRT